MFLEVYSLVYSWQAKPRYFRLGKMLLVVIIIGSIFSQCQGIYFDMYDTETKCFIEDLAPESLFRDCSTIVCLRILNAHTSEHNLYIGDVENKQFHGFAAILMNQGGMNWLTDYIKFMENIIEDISTITTYRTQLYDPEMKSFQQSSPGIGIHLEVVDPEKKVMLSRFYHGEGQFAFTSHTPGEHKICLNSNQTSSMFGGSQMLRIHIAFNSDEFKEKEEEGKPENQYGQIEKYLKILVERVEKIQKEQAYQRVREKKFRRTSKSTNSRVLWWAMIQTVVLVITGYWQMRHLTKFFLLKKLV